MQLIDEDGKKIQVKNQAVIRKAVWGGTKKGTGVNARIHYETITGKRFSMPLNS